MIGEADVGLVLEGAKVTPVSPQESRLRAIADEVASTLGLDTCLLGAEGQILYAAGEGVLVGTGSVRSRFSTTVCVVRCWWFWPGKLTTSLTVSASFEGPSRNTGTINTAAATSTIAPITRSCNALSII